MRGTFIDPGALRQELVLEAPQSTADTLGGFTVTWVEAAVVFAMLEPVSARSRFSADQMLEDVTHRVTIRHRDDVRPGMRFRKGQRVLDVVTVHDPGETGRYLVCRTREEQT